MCLNEIIRFSGIYHNNERMFRIPMQSVFITLAVQKKHIPLSRLVIKSKK